jgi:peptidyl-prolyl cis-trans isomerase C
MQAENPSPKPKLELPGRQEWGLKPQAPRGGVGWPAFWIVLLLLGVLALEALSFWRGGAPNGVPKPGSPGADPAAGAAGGIPAKELAARLQRNNLPGAAARVLEEHLETISPELREERRKTLVLLGDLLQKSGRYEEALVRYFQAEYLGPDLETKNRIDRQVMTCLEKLGKFDELEYELGDRAAAKSSSGGADESGEGAGRVVAQIGVETITQADLSALISEEVESQLASIPGLSDEAKAQYREQFIKDLQAPQKRLQVLQELVARKVLYREGMERNLEGSAAVRKELERMRESLIARQVVRKAMEDIRITEGDLKLFYQAENARYLQKASAQARIAILDSQSAAEEALSGIKTEEDFAALAREKSTHDPTRAQGGQLSAAVVEGAAVADLGVEPALTRAILSAEPGGPIAQPAAVQKGFAIAWVQKKTPPRVPTYEEVREQVARDYSQRKEMEAQQSLLGELFKKHAVNIHTEAFIHPEGGPGAEQGSGDSSRPPAPAASTPDPKDSKPAADPDAKPPGDSSKL